MRDVPVHPRLAAALAAWKLSGWAHTYGRSPRPEYLIVPTRRQTPRGQRESRNQLVRDLGLLDLRHRRGHDLRRSFISLARGAGARRDLLEAVTHGPKGDIVSMYTTFEWAPLCAEVAKLTIPPATPVLQSEKTARIQGVSGDLRVTPPGLEDGIPSDPRRAGARTNTEFRVVAGGLNARKAPRGDTHCSTVAAPCDGLLAVLVIDPTPDQETP